MQKHLESFDDALVRQEREALEIKRKQWADIQDRTPELAEFMLLLNKTFGRVKLRDLVFKK